MKPAIFIDAYINTKEKEEVFVKNINNFIDAGYDLFIISNKLIMFDKFDKVKYFEYDSRNRLLKDKDGYKQTSDSGTFTINKQYIDITDSKNSEELIVTSTIFNPTNLSVLYNTRRICDIVKEFGYTNVMRVDYDCIFKRYDFENTFLKDNDISDWNNYGVAGPGCYGLYVNWLYLNVDYFISKIPLIKTENQYKDFIQDNFGELKHLTFERIIYGLLKKLRILTDSEDQMYVGSDTNMFTTDEQYNRLDIYSDKLLAAVVNNKSLLILDNQYNTPITIDIHIDDKLVLTYNVLSNCAQIVNCKDYKTITIKHLDKIKVINSNIRYTATFDKLKL